jgi:hypothetical protein
MKITDAKDFTEKCIEDGNKQYCREATQLPGEWKELSLCCPFCDAEEFVYIYDDQKTCYCCKCMEEFDISDLGAVDYADWDSDEDKELQARLEEMTSDDPAVVKELADRLLADCDDCGAHNGCHFSTCKKSPQKSLPGFEHKTYSSAGTVPSWKACYHRPQHIIAGEGWGVWCGKKTDCQYHIKDYDVILNLTFDTIKNPHIIPIPSLAKYADNTTCTELQIDWPDYGVPDLPAAFWSDLVAYLAENKKKMLVVCFGGHGRTGTAMAILMCHALGYTPQDAIGWIRRNYCQSAVETAGQESYVSSMISVNNTPAEIGPTEHAAEVGAF